MWSTGEGNGQTTSVFLPWEPYEEYEKANDKILKEELPRSVGAQYATADQWRNNSRKNEGMEPKQKQNQIWISVHFQGKPFNIRVIQVYAPTSNAEEAEVEWFYEDLQDLFYN